MEFSKVISDTISFPVSLYIHIPFCVKKCYYCDFYSILYDEKTAAVTIAEIKNELDFFFKSIPGIVVRTIFIGGGTPSCLPPDVFENLLQSIFSLSLRNCTEWSVEANPESLNADFINLCTDYGVTRMSLGIQSTCDTLLEAVGRKTRHIDIMHSAELLRSRWQGDLNLDLITGLPGQTPDMIEADIDVLIKQFQPSHISLYALSLEKETRLEKLVREKNIMLPASVMQDRLWQTGARLLESHGYHQYEISNFAVNGKECLHNLNYWHLNPYIGIGPAAVSTLPGKEQQVVRLYHQHNISAYLKGKAGNWGADHDVIESRSFVLETCMMGFRLSAGIPRHLFVSRFGNSLEKLLPGLWEEWQGKGLAGADPDFYALTKKGRHVLNPLLVELLEQLDMCPDNLIQISWP